MSDFTDGNYNSACFLFLKIQKQSECREPHKQFIGNSFHHCFFCMCVVHAENLNSSSLEIHFTIVSAVGVAFHVKKSQKQLEIHFTSVSAVCV